MTPASSWLRNIFASPCRSTITGIALPVRSRQTSLALTGKSWPPLAGRSRGRGSKSKPSNRVRAGRDDRVRRKQLVPAPIVDLTAIVTRQSAARLAQVGGVPAGGAARGDAEVGWVGTPVVAGKVHRLNRGV